MVDGVWVGWTVHRSVFVLTVSFFVLKLTLVQHEINCFLVYLSQLILWCFFTILTMQRNWHWRILRRGDGQNNFKETILSLSTANASWYFHLFDFCLFFSLFNFSVDYTKPAALRNRVIDIFFSLKFENLAHISSPL